MSQKPSNKELFEKNKYVVVRKALSEDAARIAGNSLLLEELKRETTVDKQQVVGATAFYSNAIMESIMLQLQPVMEEATGLRLCPTYAFARVYRWGDDLAKHRDRPSCEISATLTLNYMSNELWPIFVEGPNGEEIPVSLDRGDLMIYRGCDVEHWREKLNDGIVMQVFIHFIDKDGPYYPEFSYDKKLDKVGTFNFIKCHMVNDGGFRHALSNPDKKEDDK